MFQARSVFSDEELLMLKRKSQWRAAWMIFHAWAVIFGAMALFVWWPNPLTFIAAALDNRRAVNSASPSCRMTRRTACCSAT